MAWARVAERFSARHEGRTAPGSRRSPCGRGEKFVEDAVYAYTYVRVSTSPIAATMTTIQITLPDELAKTAQAAGLLDPEAIQGMFRQQLRSQALENLRRVWKKMPAAELTPDVEQRIVAAVQQCRAEMRAGQSS